MIELYNAAKRIIPKEKVWQALRWELSDKEIAEINNYEVNFEIDDYFDLDLMLSKIHSFMRGEKEYAYFHDWCLILMRCFCNFSPSDCNYGAIGDNFDAFAFMEGKLDECRWLIAEIKWRAHNRANKLRKKYKEFLTNGVAVYVIPDAYIESSDTDLYKVLVADKSEKKFNVFYVDGLDYLEHVNYSLPQPTFDRYDGDLIDIVIKRFKHCKLDPTLNLDYYKLKGE